MTISLLLLASVASAAEQPNLTIRSLKLLAVIYRGAPADQGRMSDSDVEGARNGIALGRLFYFRNSQCRLNLDITYLVVDTVAPKNDGPTYDYFVKDLTARGVTDNQYDGIFITGVGMTGNWGGFQVFGRTGAAFGGGGKGGDLGTYPARDPNTWYDIGWTFIHEFQHALDSPISEESGRPEMLSDHPYSDSSMSYFWYGHHAGQHWDWVAHTLSTFKDYPGVKAATDSTVTTTDADGDGLPDDDPRLPMDEKRFGSDPTKKDTDGDGLDDLHEFCADIYRGSDPRKADTDGDRIPDGKDKNPTVAIADKVAYSDEDPQIDGKLDKCYKPFTLGCYIDNSPELAAARMSACWNEDALYLFVRSKTQCSLDAYIDTSAENGFWEGGDTYLLRASPDGKVVFTGLGLEGPVQGAKAVWGPDGLEVMVPTMIGQGVSGEINFGGKRRPQDVADGMVLLAGRAVSFNLMLTAGEKRALITPQWTMFDTKLMKKPSDPPRPSLRFTKKLTRSTEPVVMVTGCGPNDKVTIVDQDSQVVGQRTGSGEVKLIGKLNIGSDEKSGANVLTARAGGRESAPITLVIDTKAEPPSIKTSEDGRTLKIKGEPGAQADIFAWSGRAGAAAGPKPLPIASVTLGRDGLGEYDLAQASRSFVGAYGLKLAFDKPLFWRTDPEIKFDYNDGAPDPRSPNEDFCVRWTGFLDVPETGDYTFYLSSDDGSKLWIDGALAADNWGHHDVREKTAAAKLAKGEHEIRVDYYEEYGWAAAHLEWSGPSVARTHSLPIRPIPAAAGSPTYRARQTDAAGNVSVLAKP